ncbi:hypothetical protein DFH06DRAFT_996741 [Mycena polygramma]|nr:hypothetical protein DFH06DRAFT_996741 [Mycena polygramma]
MELDDEDSVSPELVEIAARLAQGNAAIDSIIVADEISEWVDTVLDDAAPVEPSELGFLAADCLKKARKSHDFRSTVLFAALVDFYRWMPRMGRLSAALRVAKNHGCGPAFQRVLCVQARFFEATGTLKPSHQGRRQKEHGLLDDEGFYMGVQRWLRTLETGTLHVNETLLPSLSLKKTTVSVRHCQRWLWKLGYRRKKYTKGVYWDGHEREDVKKRRKEYLAELEASEPFMPRYAEPDMAEVSLELGDGEQEHVWIVHDESTAHTNDYQNNHYWLKPGEQVLKKKGCGRLMMMSALLCERYGLLDLTDEMIAENEKLVGELRLEFTKSTTTIYPDNKAGGDAYWNMEQMIAQMVKAILIARRMFPNAIIHWVFDNSSAHGSLAKDALTTTKMNVKPGGKVPEMRETVIPSDNPHGRGGQPQKMTFDKNLPDDHPHKEFEGQPKGMKVILAERGYTTNTSGKALIGECKTCKAAKARKPHLEGASAEEETAMFGDDGNDSDEEEERPFDCCMRRLLSHQPDFAHEKSQLELLIEAAPGMVCHFLPKFHLEMNPIEYFWAWVKRYFRERSNGQWQKGKDLLEEALHACPLPTIRRFFRRANRYASVYRLGATGPVAEFAVKKYRSHRGVQKRELDTVMAEWEQKKKSNTF